MTRETTQSAIEAAHVGRDRLQEAIDADVTRYCRTLRSTQKRRYAGLYATWRAGRGPAFDHSGGPEDAVHRWTLGYMARQAVRMNIEAIYVRHLSGQD